MAIITSTSSIKNISFYQPTLVVLHTIRVGFHKESISVPFYSNCIFETPEEAAHYLPEFLKVLKQGNVITEEDVASPENFKTGVATVSVAHLEKK